MFIQIVLRYLGVVAVLSLLACAPKANFAVTNTNPDLSAIVNGKPVLATDLYARHTVAVMPEGSTPCTGVIIAPHFILSAGHCAKYFAEGNIYFGLIAKKGKATVYKVKNVTPHPRYCDTCFFGDTEPADFKDYAIVEFSEELPAGFEPVKFATHKQIKKGTIIHLAGYGLDENQKVDFVMKKTQVPVKAVGDFEFMTDETKSGSCQGDSGGPAFIMVENKIYLAGITSRGDALCRGHGLYGIASVEADWLKSVVLKQ